MTAKPDPREQFRPGKNVPWSESEDAYLLEHWQDTIDQLARVLRRGKFAISQRIQMFRNRAFNRGEILPSREPEVWNPTPAEILAACEEIQKAWSEAERHRRAGWPDNEVEITQAPNYERLMFGPLPHD